MTNVIEHVDGRYMVAAPAGGAGGGATSVATRPATWHEIMAYLERQAVAAKAHLDILLGRMDEHKANEPVPDLPPEPATPVSEPYIPPAPSEPNGIVTAPTSPVGDEHHDAPAEEHHA